MLFSIQFPSKKKKKHISIHQAVILGMSSSNTPLSYASGQMMTFSQRSNCMFFKSATSWFRIDLQLYSRTCRVSCWNGRRMTERFLSLHAHRARCWDRISSFAHTQQALCCCGLPLMIFRLARASVLLQPAAPFLCKVPVVCTTTTLPVGRDSGRWWQPQQHLWR